MLQHHIELGPEHLAGNGGLGRTVFVPGSAARAAQIAEHFVDVEVLDNRRGHTAHLGVLELDGVRVDALAISTGMGPGSAEIVVHELLAAGARRLVRVGSAGAFDPNIRGGDVCVLSGAVRDEAASQHVTPLAVPALAHPAAVAAMSEGATAAGLAEHTYVGIGQSKASLYAREFGHGPLGAANEEHARVLAASGVIASEMEASVLYILASVANAGKATTLAQGNGAVAVQAACVVGIYAGTDSDMKLDPAVCRLADQRAIEVAVHGAVAWARADGI